MRARAALLDVNVLVALFDAVHIHHEAAHTWFALNRRNGWATCPITENGFVRVISNPAYPGRRTTVDDAIERLQRFRESSEHRFWADAVSVCEDIVRPRYIQGYRQLTDIYLLALAVTNGGCLATFDQRIPLLSVDGAEAENMAFVGR